MARALRIKWDDGKAVDALLEVPNDAGSTAILLAHGAGAGQRHDFMTHVRRGLASSGIMTMTFDYAYTAEGRRAPDRMPKLLAVHAAAAERLTQYSDRVVLAGKSMGGRVASHLASDAGWGAAGLLYLGYPLVPLGKSEPRDTSHLDNIEVPQLFFAGTRDRLSPPDQIVSLAARLPNASVEVIADGDHSFKVPKRAGVTTEEVIDAIVVRAAEWTHSL